MEVHHHSHGGKKKGTGHLWEFFMLFLAVFCGFLAESLREHFIEYRSEKEYVRSIVNDLATDTAWMNVYQLDQRAAVQAFDSVILLLKKGPADSFSRRRVYYLVRMAIKMSSPNKINYSAFDQMRNSGNLRLIKEQTILDSISQYYFSATDIEQLNQTIMQRQASLVEFEGKVFDGTVLQSMEDLDNFEFKEPDGNPALATTDKSLINDFIVRTHYLVSVNVLSGVFARRQKESAIRLINYLKKEYHLK
jgi:hypothetical protein